MLIKKKGRTNFDEIYWHLYKKSYVTQVKSLRN